MDSDGARTDSGPEATDRYSQTPSGLAPLYVDTLLRAHAFPAAAGLGGVVVITVTAAILSASGLLRAWPTALLIIAELAGMAWIARRANRIDREFESMATEP